MIDLRDEVENTERRFGEATTYHPVYVRMGGVYLPAQFTAGQIDEALHRARRNPEDMPPRRRGWLERIFG